MYRTIEEFAQDWAAESAATARVLDALTDAALAREVVPGDRTVGWTAWHLPGAIAHIAATMGLSIATVDPTAPPPPQARTIADTYRRTAEELVRQIRAHWTDATLSQEDDVFGFRWTRAKTLTVLLRHEIHHRGQLTVLLRQAGLRVPGVYGPSRDDREAAAEATQS